MMDVNLKVPALEKLLDYAACGIGAVAGPMLATWKARQDAKAKLIGVQTEADSLRLIADAQADARRSLVASGEAAHGVLEIGPKGVEQRIEFQERKRQANIKSVVRDAAAELGDKEVPDREPDPDWTARFLDSVQDVSSEDMRKLWAKVLSGEIENPGRTSLRALDILKNMTKKDAELFVGVSDYIIADFIFYPMCYADNHRMLSYQNMICLQEIGILSANPLLVRKFSFSKEKISITVRYQNFRLRILANEIPKNIEIPDLPLYGPGRELYRIVEPTPRRDYIQSFARFLRKRNCDLSCARVVEKLPDGRVRHTPFTPIEPEPEQPEAAAP